MERLKAAVIGLGRMGAEPSSRLLGKVPEGWLPISHIEALQEINEIVIVSICDSDVERLEKYSKLYGIQNTYTDYKTLLDTENIDLLCIATRTLGRTDIINYACHAGVKAIYLEKPISRNIGDALFSLNLAEEKGVKIGYGVNRRYHEVYRKAKEIIHSGEFGELQHITIENGRKTLLWTHPHSVDTILFLANTTDIEYVSGLCTFSEGYKPTSEDVFIDDDPIVEHAFIKFKNGISASINQVGGNNVRIALTKGIITIYSDGNSIRVEFRKDKLVDYFPENKLYFSNIEMNEGATVSALRNLNSNLKEIKNEEIIASQKILLGIVFTTLKNINKIKVDDIPVELTVSGRLNSNYA